MEPGVPVENRVEQGDEVECDEEHDDVPETEELPGKHLCSDAREGHVDQGADREVEDGVRISGSDIPSG